MSEFLAQLMQQVHEDPNGEVWYHGLDALVRCKVEDRFLRVLYESHVRSSNATTEGEEAFRSDLVRAWREAPEAAGARLVGLQGLRYWRFDPQTDRIQIVFRESVYDGDIGHRH